MSTSCSTLPSAIPTDGQRVAFVSEASILVPVQPGARCSERMPDPSSQATSTPPAWVRSPSSPALMRAPTSPSGRCRGVAPGAACIRHRRAVRLDRQHDGHRHALQSLAEQRLTFDTIITADNIQYGLGLFEFLGVDGWVGHTGQAIGWEALGLYNPETGATIAIMLNGTSGMAPFAQAWAQLFGLGT